jgi:hypothetical protein
MSAREEKGWEPYIFFLRNSFGVIKSHYTHLMRSLEHTPINHHDKMKHYSEHYLTELSFLGAAAPTFSRLGAWRVSSLRGFGAPLAGERRRSDGRVSARYGGAAAIFR